MTTELPAGWLDELGDFLAIPSVSADPAHAGDVTRAAEWVGDFVRRLGGEFEVREGGRLLVSELAGPPGAPTVLVYGHYDVQPPDPLELWESDPFVAEPRGEWLYARGVADDKGQLWMQLKAIESLVSEGDAAGELPRRLRRRGGDRRRRDLALPRVRRRPGRTPASSSTAG